MSILSEGLVIRTTGTRPRASAAIHYQSWNIQSRAHYVLSGCWGLLDTRVPGYLVIGAGTRVGGVSCDAGGDVTREHRMHPSHVRSGRVAAVCVGLAPRHGSESLCLLLRVCRAALGTSTLHHVLITTESCLPLPPPAGPHPVSSEN